MSQGLKYVNQPDLVFSLTPYLYMFIYLLIQQDAVELCLLQCYLKTRQIKPVSYTDVTILSPPFGPCYTLAAVSIETRGRVSFGRGDVVLVSGACVSD